MSTLWKRIGILAGIFVMSAGIYFILAQKTEEKTEAVYTTMEEASFPVIYAEVGNEKRNRMPGYVQEMKQLAAQESLIALPQDRQLLLKICGSQEQIQFVEYEIRSMDLDRLVERTEITEWNQTEEGMEVTLPIQNLLTKDQEYLLHLMVQIQGGDELHYYSRIVLPSTEYAETMISFAKEFSQKTLDPEQAKTLVTYLETNNTEDNSSLGHVTIKSSFSQLTWGGLDMQLVGDMEVTLKEFDGIMGQVQVDYQLSRKAEDGMEEYYEVTDYYTMKWNPQRIYLMNFDRSMNQIFSGTRELYSGKRILLGISDLDDIQVRKSSDNRYVGYVTYRDLWSYDQTEGEAVKVFSFRGKSDPYGRNGYDRHGIEILNVKDNGDMDFLVYGYMNRGRHEGSVGVGLCSYSHKDGAIEEKFFIPVQKSYEALKQDIAQLAYMNSSNMLYLKLDSAVYGIDLTSNESMVVADGLEEGSYAISEDKRSLAWQEGESLYQGEVIHVLNLENGQKREIRGEDGAFVRALGFVMDDFVYGLTRQEDLWTVHGRVKAAPMYAIEIVDSNMSVQTRYEKTSYYFTDVQVEAARIHIKRLMKTEDGQYTYHDDDTIVCNAAAETDPVEGIGWYASDVRRKLYFVQLDHEIGNSRNIKVSVAKKVTYDSSEILMLKANRQREQPMFYAYGNGTLQGTSYDFTEAVQMAYDDMGVVKNEEQQIVWDRVNRSSSKTIQDYQSAAGPLTRHLDDMEESRDFGEGVLVLDARGCILNQMLYFIDQGIPVIAYTQGDQYVMIYGYDQYNVSLYDPQTGMTSKMGLNDAAGYFSGFGNDFICGISIKK